MGRPESQIMAGSQAVGEFAAGLRHLRVQAGEPTYRQLARACHFSAATLARAASGHHLPSLEVTLAYVEACGGDAEQWRARWLGARAQTRPDAEPEEPAKPEPAEQVALADPPRRHPARRWVVAVAAVSVALNVVLVVHDLNTATPAAAKAPAVLDGTDPKVAGCGTDASDLAHAPVVLARAQAIGARHFDAGTTLGTVSLRWSPRCAGAWARFDPAGHTFSDPTQATVTIGAARPAEGTLTSFRLAHIDQAYSDLLLTGIGCVTATATVTFVDGNTASGTTGCLPHL